MKSYKNNLDDGEKRYAKRISSIQIEVC